MQLSNWFCRKGDDKQVPLSVLSENQQVVASRVDTNTSESTVVNNLAICDSSTSTSAVPSSPFIGHGPDSLEEREGGNNYVDQNGQNCQRYQNRPLVGLGDYVSEDIMVKQLSVNRLSIGKQGLDLDVNLYKDIDPPVTAAKLKGVGAFGKVYKSMYKDKLAAVKVFNMEHQMPMKLPEMDSFLKELNIICRLKHKYIVECYGACLRSGNRAIIMEYVDYSLYEYIYRKDHSKIELKSIYLIVKGIAKALQFLHYNKIIHRDLHPKNVLITKEGCVKVGDFGISRMMQSQSISSHFDSCNDGLPQYLAPELFSQKVVPKSDVFSLGTIAWELYTASKPWEGYGYGAIMRRIQAGERLPLPQDMPKELKNIISKCWEQQHRQRPAASKIVDLCRGALRRLN
eukprot:TRINITY_DN32212_c0_g2_i1.p1 TRINITY_DN32212_c0_g2~~TRINITY_DN32212_c0_g2_i1.p1  ORF type:complete len:400 (+),score=42.05 TRINITY_DN32212_c0_g2_i1:96-1295(+)